MLRERVEEREKIKREWENERKNKEWYRKKVGTKRKKIERDIFEKGGEKDRKRDIEKSAWEREKSVWER